MSQYGTARGTPVGNQESQDSRSQQGQHKRVYQACIPCRRRKVRCDLGSVDNPSDPPCVRCRRESKECYFSATRRKRKNDDGDLSDGEEYVVRNGRKRGPAHDDPPPPPRIERHMYSDVPLTPGGSQGRREPLRRPDGTIEGPRHGVKRSRRDRDFGSDGDDNQHMENPDAQTVMRQGVYGPHDALDLLYKAATNTTDRLVATPRSVTYQQSLRQHVDNSSPLPVAHRRVESRASIGSLLPPQATVDDRADRSATIRNPTPAARSENPIEHEFPKRDSNTPPGYIEAVRAWSRFRFVRAGWFTPQEAIEYIDYNLASHGTLLTDEPILAVTLLTIASRYKQMSGTGGHCRSHAIHEQLWTYLRGMIERCLWGQEAFGGGFCGSGLPGGVESLDDNRTSSTAPWRGMRKGSLRTLGTIESLMILTEWHPRALHFPPTEATDELMLPLENEKSLLAAVVDDDPSRQPGGAGFGGKRLESWLEPAWRSDRMCWMLLSTAMGLGYELGVFDDIDELLKDDAITRPEYQEEVYRQRANRIKRLLLIYTSQLAGRLGWTSMAPEHLRKADPAVARRRPYPNDESTPGTALSSSFSNAFIYVPDLELDDQIIHCWAGISNAMHMGNEKLFRSRKHTTAIIQSGKYVDLLGEFAPLLRDWYKEFERFRLPQFLRHILTIEYEYVRIYINSLSLQAVVERCTNNAGNANGVVNGAQAAPHNASLSPQTILSYGKLPLGQLGGFTIHDQEYVREVVQGSRNLLRTVVDGLLPSGHLKHAPVRTYFRIISGAMFLLKTFALGAPRSDVKISIDLMDATVEGLRNCVVDDVHLGIRFADLLETLTSRLRNRFIQAPTMQKASDETPPIVQNGGQEQASGDGGWVDRHAQSLRQGLNEHRAHGMEGNNISATPFDLSSGNFPYPGGASLGPGTPAPVENSNPSAPGAGMDVTLFDDWNNPGNEMWYLPTGPAFFQNMEGNAVSMTAEGVNVGGLDLLDYMAMDPSQFSGVDSSGGNGGSHAPGPGGLN
ncbi:unnamed protein product [Clonostachys byssicola]|uniref:Zn(2)-C6 fungal-type domain-containing protein n=1 Tax=Clonostachys byssicola TaxID=160290 RepID=A0A9N9UHZ4_9HYPO|nr:unnamed protein product [Clonostachys byssicola]